MTGSSTGIPRLSRRRLCRWLAGVGGAAWLAPLLSGCQARVVEVERVVKVEKEVTKIVTEIVRQTVVVERTQTAPQPTPGPSPAQPKSQLAIQAVRTPWTLYVQRMTPAFEELFGVTVHWHPLGAWAGYAALVAAQHASGVLADLVEAPAGVLPLRWQFDGVIHSMQALCDSGAVDTQGILTPALAAFQHGKTLLGLPFLAHGGDHLLGYNARHLASLQLPQPDATWTLADLDAMNASLAGVSPLSGFGASAALPAALPLLRLFGMRLFDAQGLVAVEPERLADMLSWIRRLTEGVAGPNAPDVLSSPAQGLLAGQRVAAPVSLAQASGWLWQAEQQADREPAFAATLFPRRDGQAARAISISAMGFCLNSAATALDAAAQWLKYVSGREMGVQMFLQGLAAPGCRAASWTDQRVLDVMPICAAIAQELEQAPPPEMPASLALEQCYQVWNAHLDHMRTSATIESELLPLLAALQGVAEGPA